MRLRVEHAPRFGSDHSRLVLEIDTDRKEEESQEAARFRALTTPLLGEWRHVAEASKNQWGSQPYSHFRKLEEMLTKSAKECLGVTGRWSRKQKGRAGGRQRRSCTTGQRNRRRSGPTRGDPEPKRRRTEKSHGGEEGEDAHAEPRLRELVRQGHLRLKEEEKEKEQTDRIARGRLGRREGLNDLQDAPQPLQGR